MNEYEITSKSKFWSRNARNFTKSRHVGYPADRVSPSKIPPFFTEHLIWTPSKILPFVTEHLTWAQFEPGPGMWTNLVPGLRESGKLGPAGLLAGSPCNWMSREFLSKRKRGRFVIHPGGSRPYMPWESKITPWVSSKSSVGPIPFCT